MSKPIKLTEDLLTRIQNEFIESVRNMKMFDGKISYTKNFKWDDTDGEKASVMFTPVAFAKMVMLLQEFSSEVAWHGVTYRSSENKNHFLVTDILVYPQVVTGSTVNTDQDEYTNWLYEQDDETFNNLKMQGHSHVNFGTTPSGVDTTHQEQILSQLDDDMFYIFMIWNKKFEHTIKIYDLANNTLYEDGDIDVLISEDGVDLNAFIKGAKDLVKTKKYTYPTQGASAAGAQKPVTVAASGQNKPKGKPKEKPRIGSGWPGSMYGEDEEYGSYFDRYYR